MNDTELSKSYEASEVEARWYPVWMERGYFRADATSAKPSFCIVLPPPNVTGSLHLGHALTATIQDILVRWKRMNGHNCLWLPGTDHAGIATQMVVEKELKATEKKSRHDLGRAEFLKRVWKWKEKYGARIAEQHKVLGASLDWSRERFTMDEGLSAAVREVFVRLFDEGLLYRAKKLINWCPSCQTALSDLEVEHEEAKPGTLWHIAYPVKGSQQRLVVATTRPETMLGDTAVAIHPDDPRYAGLAGGKVVLPLVGREIPIVADAQLVNMEFGTGVVKVTPAHDFNDYQTGLRHQLEMISIFDERARTNAETGPYAGIDRYEARKRVLEDLTAQGLLVKEEPHTLAIGTCQRCTTVVEPRLSMQWFVKIDPLARPAIEAVEQGRTRFVPESWTQTYFSWMRNIHDWCVSRQLWWGHQIPAFYCKGCSPKLDDGSVDFNRASCVVARQAPASCAGCGGSEFEQDPDVLDTWFSSGLWPFSTLGWPEQTPELKTFYPTSVMETGHDIIFFWVARMMMMGLHFMKDVPFKTVYLHAMVRDEKGEKMSKTKGNVIDPLDVVLGAKPEALAPNMRNRFPQGMPAFGADALRFTLASLTMQGRDIKLSLDRVAGYKAFANKLWNASRFALMNMGTFRAEGGHVKDRRLSLADRWILSRLGKAIEGTRGALEQYQFAEAASILYQFLWGEFCDWYIELAKSSLYGDDPESKEATRTVLVYCLDQILRLLHPFMPFITEEIWQRLPMERSADSVMVAAYPTVDRRLADAEAEAEMEPLIAAIDGIRSIRGETNIPPAARLTAHIQASRGQTREILERWRSYLMPLAGLSEVHIGPPGPKPPQAAAHVGREMEVFVPLAGVIDLGEETARLKKELAKTDGDIAGIARKLENPNFVAKAPPEVVEKDRARLDELRARRAKLEENLARLSPEPAMPAQPPKPTPALGGSSKSNGGPKDSAEFEQELAGAKVHISSGGGSETNGVDLAAELEGELEQVPTPQLDPTVKAALDKLREGTKKGLSPEDHKDLGVAYMQMGLVDDAAREFVVASKRPIKGGKKPASKAPKSAKALKPTKATKPAKPAKGAKGKSAVKLAKTAKPTKAKKPAKPKKLAKPVKAAKVVAAKKRGAKAAKAGRR